MSSSSRLYTRMFCPNETRAGKTFVRGEIGCMMLIIRGASCPDQLILTNIDLVSRHLEQKTFLLSILHICIH